MTRVKRKASRKAEMEGKMDKMRTVAGGVLGGDVKGIWIARSCGRDVWRVGDREVVVVQDGAEIRSVMVDGVTFGARDAAALLGARGGAAGKGAAKRRGDSAHYRALVGRRKDRCSLD